MKRKIIKQGHNTLTITLPNQWAQKLNLKAGDEIEVAENEDTLVINSHQNGKNKDCTINIDNFTVPLLWRYFQSAYRSGCDEIKIAFNPTKQKYEDAFHYYTTQFDYASLGEKVKPKALLVMIQEIVDRFIGIEIVESGKDYCVIKEMGEISPREFENSLRRIFLIILQLFERTIQAIEKNEIKETALCREIHSIDLIVDKFVDYCARILNRTTTTIPERRKPLIFSTLFILELIGDEFKYIAKHIALSKKPVRESLGTAKIVQEHFEMYYNLFYKFDRNLSIKFGEKDVEVYKENFRTKEKIHGDERSIIKHFIMISKLTFALGELRIQMEF
jgi:phosphate uptake regulator